MNAHTIDPKYYLQKLINVVRIQCHFDMHANALVSRGQTLYFCAMVLSLILKASTMWLVFSIMFNKSFTVYAANFHGVTVNSFSHYDLA